MEVKGGISTVCAEAVSGREGDVWRCGGSGEDDIGEVCLRESDTPGERGAGQGWGEVLDTIEA